MSGVFARLIFITAILFSLPPLAFLVAGLTAPGTFRLEQERQILAAPEKVWEIVTDWTRLGAGMNKLMPRIGKRRVLGGEEPAPGRVVRYALAGGRDWDQRIMRWEPPRRYEFRNEQGVAAGMPGDVAMGFLLEPSPGGFTRVRYRIEIKPEGFANRALTQIFGIWVGTLRGYGSALLDVVKAASEGGS